MRKEQTHILLVDDEEVLLDLMSEVLRDYGYDVTALTNGPDALDAFLGGPGEFDLVVAEEKMPHLSGTDLAEEILGVRPDIPFILYTDYPEIASAKKARAVGVKTVLQKSSRTEELVACIRRLLDS